MEKDPIILALANPVPEILPEAVQEVRSDAIIATGRSDYPNQVNNVLCFPFIFRGALDVRAPSGFCLSRESALFPITRFYQSSALFVLLCIGFSFTNHLLNIRLR